MERMRQRRFRTAGLQFAGEPGIFGGKPPLGIVERPLLEQDAHAGAPPRRVLEREQDGAVERIGFGGDAAGMCDLVDDGACRGKLEHRRCHHDKGRRRLAPPAST